jgi:hypothetical protein
MSRNKMEIKMTENSQNGCHHATDRADAVDYYETYLYESCRLFGDVHGEVFQKIITFLDNSDFYDAPASTRYHGACAGGLVAHHLAVYEYVNELIECDYYSHLDSYAAGFAALVHDFCKIGVYHKNDDGRCFFRDDSAYKDYDHSEKSLKMVEDIIGQQLPDAVAEAILYHMGAYDKKRGAGFTQAARKNCLILLVHTADMMSACE